jgi:RNA polymerase sigma factor (TIGR02999 family)
MEEAQDSPSNSRRELNEALPRVYEELRRIAHGHLRDERAGHTLNTTALVHEAYLRLAGVRAVDWQDRPHFLSMASRAMRRVLVDYARARRRQKRDAASAPLMIEGPSGLGVSDVDELIALDEALTRLETIDARQSRVVECRFFAGLDIDETAQVLGISPASVKRDWTVCRAWLNAELAGGSEPEREDK